MKTCTPLSGIGGPARVRGDGLLLSCALAGIVAGVLAPTVAQAADECGRVQQDTVICKAARNPTGNGVDYTTSVADPTRHPGLDATAPVHDLTVSISSGVSMLRPEVADIARTRVNTGAATLDTVADTGIAVSGAITVSGADGNGIGAPSTVGNITVNAATVVPVSRADGLIATDHQGKVQIDVAGASAGGDDSATRSGVSRAGGDVSVVSHGTVITRGDYTPGVVAVAGAGGDSSATVNNVKTFGYRSHAVYALGDAVDVTIHGDLRTAGILAAGVVAQAFDGRSTVTNNGSIGTTGNGGIGIFAYGSNGVTISGTGTVATAGPGASGIVANGYDGATSVIATSVSTSGDYSRGVSVDGSGDLTLDLGNVTTNGRISSAIEAATFQNGTGPLDADLRLTVGTVTVNGDYSQGINAFSSNDGVLEINVGTVAVHGTDGNGILSASFTADTTINADTVITTGMGDAYNGPSGIYATSDSGSITITSSNLVSIQGLNGKGVFASTAGDVAIDVNDVSTLGDNASAVMAIGGQAGVTINGDVSTAGASSAGVFAHGRTGSAVTNNGMIATAGYEANGIDADGGAGDAIIGGSGGVITRGNASAAILARSTGGSITVTGGAIRTSGSGSAGIDAAGAGGVIVEAASVDTRGINSTGITANSVNSVSVTADAVSTGGTGSNGIDAASAGGDVIVHVGSVRTSGAGTTAVQAYGAGGADLSVADAVRSESGVGVRLRAGAVEPGDAGSDARARLTVASGGSIAGGTDAVVIASTGGAVMNNAGIIAGGSGYALRLGGGSAALFNSGDIRGRLLLTGGGDTLTNSGMLTLTGASGFGAGADLLSNSGTIRLATTGTAQTVSLAGLETLNSSGAIELRNGVTGDWLILTDTVLTGTTTSSLGVDVAFARGAAATDRLVLGRAAGSTTVALAMSGTPILIAPTTIVDVVGVSSPDAFAIAPQSSGNGLVTFGIAYLPADRVYQLVSAPSAAVYRQVQLGEVLTSLWNRSADAASAHLAASRDAARAAEPAFGTGRIWFQTLGEVDHRKDSRNFDFLGLAQTGVDLGYRQDAVGMQLGVDLVRGSPKDGFIAGISGGYVNSTVRFSAGTGDRFKVDAGNVGLYAGFSGGPFFVNGLANYDFYRVKRRSAVVAIDGDDNAHAWGGKVEAGLRLGSADFFAEPRASLAYSRTSLDDFTVGDDAFDYDRFTGLRGKAGLRIGRQTRIGGSTVAFYLDGAAVKEFEGRDGLRFTSGNQIITLHGDRPGAYSQGTLGVNVTTASGISGFIEGHGEFGKAYRGGGGRAGLRIGF